jgi:AraC family transcriptional regulator
MNPAFSIELEQPGIAVVRPLLIAGLKDSFTRETMKGIPALWQRFISEAATIPQRVEPRVHYGIYSFSATGSLSYLAGVEVRSAVPLPPGFNLISIPQQQYAVFRHHGHVSELAKMCDAIRSSWLPASGYHADQTPGAPHIFERYGENSIPLLAGTTSRSGYRSQA